MMLEDQIKNAFAEKDKLIEMLAEWCIAIEKCDGIQNEPSWKILSHHYHNAKYRDAINKKMVEIKERK